eukprot:Gb_25066 [translate_table: standard]
MVGGGRYELKVAKDGNKITLWTHRNSKSGGATFLAMNLHGECWNRLLALPNDGEDVFCPRVALEQKWNWIKTLFLLDKLHQIFHDLMANVLCGFNLSLYLMGFYYDAMGTTSEHMCPGNPSILRWWEFVVDHQGKKGKKTVFEQELEDNDNTTIPTEEEEELEGMDVV